MAKFAVALCILLAAYEAQGSAASDLNTHITNQKSYFGKAVAALDQPAWDRYGTGASNINMFEIDIKSAINLKVETFNARVAAAVANSSVDVSACATAATSAFEKTSEVTEWISGVCIGSLRANLEQQYDVTRNSFASFQSELQTIEANSYQCSNDVATQEDCLKQTAQSFCEVNNKFIGVLFSVSDLNGSYLDYDGVFAECNSDSNLEYLGTKADEQFTEFEKCVEQLQAETDDATAEE